MTMIAARRRAADGRVLTWSDEFDKPTVDANYWTAMNRGELEYVNHTDDPANLFIEDSCLVIRAIRGTPKWTSVWLRSDGKFAFRYGRLEAKIKLPVGHGTFPAFWLHGDTWHIKYPEYISGEIDIFEHWDYRPDNMITVFKAPAGATRGTPVNVGYYNVDVTQWHVYALEWTPDTLEFFLDGEKVGTTVNVEDYTNEVGWNPLRKPMTIMLQNDIGGTQQYSFPDSYPPDETTPSPNDMRVDWVRLYAPVGKGLVKQTGMSVTPASKTLLVGTHDYLDATVLPTDASDQTIKWRSSDNTVCTVAQNHLIGIRGKEYTARGGVRTYIEGHKPGKAIITASSNEGWTASCLVTVTA